MNSAHEDAFACPRVEMHLYNTLFARRTQQARRTGHKEKTAAGGHGLFA